MQLYYWGSLAVTSLSILVVGVSIGDVQLVVLSAIMLGYSTYFYVKTLGIL